ncbi:nonstructural protein 1 [Galliform chaphamaparvovirus 12]|nr:nonstructural protein 1 [Galliform chaphamaparvovirus 12]
MQEEVECSRIGFGIILWVGTPGTTTDIPFDQAPSYLVDKDWEEITDKATLEKSLKYHDMKEHQCGVFQISDPSMTPIISPLLYAMVFNQLSTVTNWTATAEFNNDGVFHVHALFKTTVRTDSLRRSLMTVWERLQANDAFTRRWGLCSFDLLKLQKCHKPSSLMGYMMKQPIWLLGDSEAMLKMCCEIDCHNLNARFKEKQEQIDTKEMNELTETLVEVITRHNCQTFEDILRAAPKQMAKYLHRPGLPAVVANCLTYVSVTGGSWSIELFANYDADPSAIHKVLLHQGIPPVDFDEAFHKWITKADPKKNTITIQGPSNTGKSAFISGMKTCIPWGEIVNTEPFAFEGLLNGVIGIWEEPLCSATLAEKTKQIFEGMTTAIPIKYKKPAMLPRKPIMITTNHDPWRFCTNEEPMFRNRMWIFFFQFNCHETKYICRTSEHRCKCPYCTASSSCSSTVGESVTCEVQRGKQPLHTGEQSIRSTQEPDVHAGSLRDPGEGTSWSHHGTYGSSSTSSEKCSTYSAGSTSSTSTTTEQHIRSTEHRSSHTGERACHSSTRPRKPMVPRHAARDYGFTSYGTRDITSWFAKRTRDHGSTGDNLDSMHQLPTLATGLLSENTETHQISTKKRRLDRTMVTRITNLDMSVPSMQDWQCYLSWIHNYYG